MCRILHFRQACAQRQRHNIFAVRCSSLQPPASSLIFRAIRKTRSRPRNIYETLNTQVLFHMQPEHITVVVLLIKLVTLCDYFITTPHPQISRRSKRTLCFSLCKTTWIPCTYWGHFFTLGGNKKWPGWQAAAPTRLWENQSVPFCHSWLLPITSLDVWISDITLLWMGDWHIMYCNHNIKNPPRLEESFELLFKVG